MRGRRPGAADDPPDRGGELRGVGGVAALDGVVEHDAVVVVDDLGLVAELDRPAEPALGDRAGIAVVQADPPGRPVRGGAGQPLAGLRGDPPGRGEQLGQVVDRAAQPAPPASGGRIRPPGGQLRGLGAVRGAAPGGR